MTKQYAERDAMALDEAGGYYMRHVMAMTGEQLHGKGDIAAELGWRDMQIAALQQKLDAVLAENVMLKNGIGFFSYGSDSGFEEHDSAEKAIAAADADIDYYRGDACDGWSEETDQTVWGVILQRATMIDEQPRTEELPYGSCDFALLPNISTSATDAILNQVRAEGLAMFAAQRADLSKTYAQNQDSKMAIQNDWVASKAQLFADQLRANKIKVGD